MDRSRLELSPGVWLDARRAVLLEENGVLAIADLHLGYSWAHRHDGNLLPISAREDSVERLAELVRDYRPREVALLGDIVHRAILLPALQEELCRLFGQIEELAPLRLILGNHDANLRRLLHDCGLEPSLARVLEVGPHLLLHGDEMDETVAATALAETRARGGRIFIGHEHPAFTLSDGVASRVKCPCFLASEELVVLPAFSRWAAGTDVREARFLSPYARQTRCTRAIVVAAGKLLPLRLSS
ncbi:MAG TPA: metallophosphoesterase [Chthoniobacteraceae bacterium]|jgi:hypothetical protein